MQKMKCSDSLARFSIEQLTSKSHTSNPEKLSNGEKTISITRNRDSILSAKDPTKWGIPFQPYTQNHEKNSLRKSPENPVLSPYLIAKGYKRRQECVSDETDRIPELKKPYHSSGDHKAIEQSHIESGHSSFVKHHPETVSREVDADLDRSRPSSPESEESTSLNVTHSESTDDSDKPTHSYIALISMAILACPEKKLVLSDIYQYIMDNFPFYNNQERAWRNSIRHNLSLNECFIKAGRAENGKGNYWSIHPACIEDFSKGDYRRRHARRRARGSAYSDINVSALPFNYRYNIGYVPMTPSPVLGYPYPIPYIPHTSAPMLRGVDVSAMASMASMASLVAQQKANMNSLLSEELKRPVSDAKNSIPPPFPFSVSTPSSSSPSKPPPLLSPAPLPGMLSPSLPYSPYAFPFL